MAQLLTLKIRTTQWNYNKKKHLRDRITLPVRNACIRWLVCLRHYAEN